MALKEHTFCRDYYVFLITSAGYGMNNSGSLLFFFWLVMIVKKKSTQTKNTKHSDIIHVIFPTLKIVKNGFFHRPGNDGVQLEKKKIGLMDRLRNPIPPPPAPHPSNTEANALFTCVYCCTCACCSTRFVLRAFNHLSTYLLFI